MARIIKAEDGIVSIGTNDGKIRDVSENAVNYEFSIGDEVEIYENDDSIIVTKKVSQVVYKKRISDIYDTLLFVFIAISLAACFLPILTISFLGLSESVNFVYNDGNLSEGLILVGIQAIALLLLALKSKLLLALTELGAVGAFVFIINDLGSELTESLSKITDSPVSVFNFLGAGGYILIFALIISAVLAIINATKEES